MAQSSTNDLIAHIAPRFIAYFGDRAGVDFRVFPGDPERLLVFVRFGEARGHHGDLAALKALADDAALHVDGCGANHNSAWIELPVQGPGAASSARDDVIVPFPGTRSRQL
jgi:hypothetical protein